MEIRDLDGPRPGALSCSCLSAAKTLLRALNRVFPSTSSIYKPHPSSRKAFTFGGAVSRCYNYSYHVRMCASSFVAHARVSDRTLFAKVMEL